MPRVCHEEHGVTTAEYGVLPGRSGSHRSINANVRFGSKADNRTVASRRGARDQPGGVRMIAAGSEQGAWGATRPRRTRCLRRD
jgi:hypothetical protein